jgi:putative ABC transport system permease protein
MIRIPRVRQPPFSLEDDSFQIVGVVRDTHNRGLTGSIRAEAYVPYTILGLADNIVALTQADPDQISRAVLSQVYAIDRSQPVTDVRTMEAILKEGVLAAPRFNLVLFGIFASLGLTLAVVGVYGVMANIVAQQTHDIGVRMAIGASPGNVAGMILQRGARLLLAGLGLGLLGGFLTARLLARQISDVSPFDPLAFAAVSLVLLLSGLLACVWPALRAARVDPMEALRNE